MKQSKRKKEFKSEFSYNRLWKMLIDRNMKKGELQEISDVSAASIAKWVVVKMSQQMSCSGFVKPLIAILKTLWSEFPSNRIKRRMHKRRGVLLWKS